MKRLTSAALSTLLLAGCGAGAKAPQTPQPPTKQSFTEIVNSDIPSDTAEKSSIIYRERLYSADSYTKSDLIIQSDGKVWCGFYMHNEGTIDQNGDLWTSDNECLTDYKLDDDRWLESQLSETSDDDFMLFGDTFDLAQLEGDDLSLLTESVSQCEPLSTYKETELSPGGGTDDGEVNTVDLIIGGKICRVYMSADAYTSHTQDPHGCAAVVLVHSSDYYERWRELCSQYLVPYVS